jgi:glycosyltransferase involved in cell wall biosynthesis
VHNGIVLPERRPRNEARAFLRAELGLLEAIPVIGMVGRLAEQKGHKYLLEAAPAILEKVPDVHFAFIGEGEERSALEGLAAKRGVAERVHWMGFRSDTQRLLAGFDVLAMPSEFEGLPLVLLEAMAHGVPIVAHAVDGIPEAVTDGQEGYLIARGDIRALAERLVQLLLDPAEAERMGERARARIDPEFTVRTMAERTAEIYSRAMDRSS